MCAVCAAKISERRRVELTSGIEAWRAQGGQVVMVTYTVRHQLADDLAMVLKGLREARRLHKTGKASAAARAVFVASVRAVEITHGANGWHPHIHELLFIAPGVAWDEAAVVRDLGGRWASAVATVADRLGLGLQVNGHGFALTTDWATISDYVTKVGDESDWTMAHEVTKQVVKRGRKGSRTATDLLDSMLLGDELAGDLWREFARATFRQKQLEWSPGGRALLGLGVEKSDEELAAEVSDQAVLMAMLTVPEWRVILGNDLRAELLAVAGRGDRDEVLRWLAEVLAG
jgi:hypothetical protein